VNPRHDTTTGLVDYLCHHADAIVRPAGLRLRFDIAPGISALPIASDRRHQLFLAFKEALANVLKHAAATEVHLRIRAEGGSLRVIVEDNGRGFDPACVSATSDGLLNLRQRLAGIGGKALIARLETGGTRVEFRLPLTSP
jgi:signal transduction histidine kinase